MNLYRNTAVFGPTNFIGTITTITTIAMYGAEDEKWRCSTVAGRGNYEKFYLFIFC